jgi:acyl-coenzyme A synthetase/AMP-(fatty) acid ligase
MSDCPEMMIAMLGVMGMGAVVVPCSTMLKPAEIEYMLKDSGAKLVIVTPEHLENAKAAHAPKIIDDLNHLLEKAKPASLGSFTAETPCLILYTSGSTGSPKGAVHLHDHLPETIERVAKVVYKLGPDDRIFSSRLFFAYGLGNNFLFRSVLAVRSCCERAAGAAAHRRHLQASPADDLLRGAPVFRALISTRNGAINRDRLSQFCVSAGEVLPVATWNEWKALAGSRSSRPSAPPSCCMPSSTTSRTATGSAAQGSCSKAMK